MRVGVASCAVAARRCGGIAGDPGGNGDQMTAQGTGAGFGVKQAGQPARGTGEVVGDGRQRQPSRVRGE
jgi:hypothetical protein